MKTLEWIAFILSAISVTCLLRNIAISDKLSHSVGIDEGCSVTVRNAHWFMTLSSEAPLESHGHKLLSLSRHTTPIYETLETCEVGSYTREIHGWSDEVVSYAPLVNITQHLILTRVHQKYGTFIDETMKHASRLSSLYNIDLGYRENSIRNARYIGDAISTYGVPANNDVYLVVGYYDGTKFSSIYDVYQNASMNELIARYDYYTKLSIIPLFASLVLLALALTEWAPK